MNSLLKNKFSLEKNNFLYETLKLKKNLEMSFLKGNTKIDGKNLKLILKGLLITNSISFAFDRRILKLINILEKKLNKNFSDFKIKGENFRIENINTIDDSPLFFNKLIEFNDRLEKHKSNLIVQGSYADNTYISYSDLDLVIIGYLSEEVKNIKNKIEEFLLTVDPLQHHGVFFINKNSFINYWQMDLPIETLKKALVLSKTSTLEINTPTYFDEKISSYNWVLNFINGYPSVPISLNSGVFFAKYFISQLLLVPALLLATKGNYIYKRESFSSVKKYYSNEAWECIKIASSIRERWNQKYIDTKYSSIRKNTTIKKVEEYNIITDVVNIKNKQIEEFSEKYLIFINETEELLIKVKNEI